MELRDYIRLLRRRWVIILVVLLACLAGAAGATVLQKKTYKSSTEVLGSRLLMPGLDLPQGDYPIGGQRRHGVR